MKRWTAAALCLLLGACAEAPLRGTGDLGIVIERQSGRVRVVETTTNRMLGEVGGLGDISHASAVFSRDGRYAYVFGRDGGLTKVDLLRARVVKRVVQSGNAIGGAISQDGRLVAVANYSPGGIRIFDSDTLELLADVPTGSKVVGIADAPGERFVFSLFEAGEIWIVDASDARHPRVTRLRHVGRQPYDGLITPDGRYYVAGLFGEDGLVMVDLWAERPSARRVLEGYGRGEAPLPVYKMPHMRGWALAGHRLFLPAVGRHELLVVDTDTWREVGRIPVHGQPVFAVAEPDGRRLWVNFAFPQNGVVQVVDTQALRVVHELRPGRAVMHLEFTPRGEHVWVSSRDDNVVVVYDTRTLAEVARLPVEKPSGIFFTARADRIGL